MTPSEKKKADVRQGKALLKQLPRVIRDQMFRDTLRLLRDDADESGKCHSLGTVFINIYNTPAGRFAVSKVKGGFAETSDFVLRRAMVEGILAIAIEKKLIEAFMKLHPPLYLITDAGDEFLKKSDSMGSVVAAYLVGRYFQ